MPGGAKVLGGAPPTAAWAELVRKNRGAGILASPTINSDPDSVANRNPILRHEGTPDQGSHRTALTIFVVVHQPVTFTG